MDKLDRAVVDHLEWRLLDPARLATMMDQLLERREEWNERRRGHIAELRKRAAETEAKLKRLYEAIENGVVDMADPSLKDRIAELTAVRDQAQADAERATSGRVESAPFLLRALFLALVILEVGRALMPDPLPAPVVPVPPCGVGAFCVLAGPWCVIVDLFR